VVAGSAHGLDAEPPGCDRIDLAVAVLGDQHLGAVVGTADERRHEVLAVPHGEDHRQLRFQALVDTVGLDREAAGLPHQTQIPGAQDADRLHDPRLPEERPSPRH